MISLLLYESSMLSAVEEFARRTYRSSAQIRFLLARVWRGTLHFWTPPPRNTGCSPADKPRGGDVQLRRSINTFFCVVSPLLLSAASTVGSRWYISLLLFCSLVFRCFHSWLMIRHECSSGWVETDSLDWSDCPHYTCWEVTLWTGAIIRTYLDNLCGILVGLLHLHLRSRTAPSRAVLLRAKVGFIFVKSSPQSSN